MLPQPLEHSNYRQGGKRIRWAHLLVSPTRGSYATHICSAAVLLWLPGLIYQINGAGEKLRKGSRDVNGGHNVAGKGGMKRAQKNPTRRNASLPPAKKAASCYAPSGSWGGREREKSKLSTLLPPIPLISGYFCAHSCVTILLFLVSSLGRGTSPGTWEICHVELAGAWKPKVSWFGKPQWLSYSVLEKKCE